MTSTVEAICKNRQCKKVFYPRKADVKRGWGKFCCKSCKAIEQEQRTGVYAAYLHRSEDVDYECGWDAHKGVF